MKSEIFKMYKSKPKELSESFICVGHTLFIENFIVIPNPIYFLSLISG